MEGAKAMKIEFTTPGSPLPTPDSRLSSFFPKIGNK